MNIKEFFNQYKKPILYWFIFGVAVLIAAGGVWYYSNSSQEQTTKDYYQELDDKYPKDFQGAYAVKYPYGTERLILKSDGVYEQLFAFNGETLHTINSGNWEIRNIGEKQLVLHWPVIVDNGFGKPTNLEKKNGIWPLRIKKSITGKIHFPINEDLDFEFNLEASERVEEKQKIIGKIIFSDIEGGCWGFQGDNGEYFLIGGDDKSEEIKKIPNILSKKMEIQGKIEKDIAHFCPVGDGLFKLESYRIIDDSILDLESVISITKEVSFTTDQKEYNQGEEIKITIKNNLDKAIWFNAQFPLPPAPSPNRGISVEEAYDFSTVSAEKFSNNVWEKVSTYYGLTRPSPSEWVDSYASKLEPGKEFSFNWGQDLSGGGKTQTGSYKIKLDYYTFDYGYAKKLTKRGTSITESYQIINGVKVPVQSPEGWEKAEKDGFKHTNFSNEFIIKSKSASYKGCSADNDCVIASPLCGNSQCLPGDKECSVGCENVFAINKDNKNLWDMSVDNIKCLYPGPSCELMPSPSFYYPICKNNLCEAIFKK